MFASGKQQSWYAALIVLLLALKACLKDLTWHQAVVGSLNWAESPFAGGCPMTGVGVLIQSFSLGSDTLAGLAMPCTCT